MCFWIIYFYIREGNAIYIFEFDTAEIASIPERDMNMVKMSFDDLNKELSKEELQELENAAARTIVYDEESPEMTPEMLKQFKKKS